MPTLPVIGEHTEPSLASAVRNLVDAKLSLAGDGWNDRSSILGASLQGRLGSEPAMPSELVRTVLPLIDFDLGNITTSSLLAVRHGSLVVTAGSLLGIGTSHGTS